MLSGLYGALTVRISRESCNRQAYDHTGRIHCQNSHFSQLRDPTTTPCNGKDEICSDRSKNRLGLSRLSLPRSTIIDAYFNSDLGGGGETHKIDPTKSTGSSILTEHLTNNFDTYRSSQTFIRSPSESCFYYSSLYMR